jgi:hypothetical protein
MGARCRQIIQCDTHTDIDHSLSVPALLVGEGQGGGQNAPFRPSIAMSTPHPLPPHEGEGTLG